MEAFLEGDEQPGDTVEKAIAGRQHNWPKVRLLGARIEFAAKPSPTTRSSRNSVKGEWALSTKPWIQSSNAPWP